jgi:hypothetical protein
MKIQIQYPLVMKMQHVLHCEVSDTPTVQEVQKKAFDSFWEFMSGYSKTIKPHGSFRQVRLECAKDGTSKVFAKGNKKSDNRRKESKNRALQKHFKTCSVVHAIFEIQNHVR